jgi:hypothetical protein
MPMKPASPDSEAERHQPAQQPTEQNKHDHADDADGGVLPAQIRLGALADRRRDFLHAGGAGVGREHRARRPDAVDDRKQAGANDQPQRGHEPHPCRALARLFFGKLESGADIAKMSLAVQCRRPADPRFHGPRASLRNG